MSKCECRDCIHYEACQLWCKGYAESCDTYKDKSLFVELPCRCNDCKHYCANYCTRDIKGRTNMFYMNENDYCSYAEIKLREVGE